MPFWVRPPLKKALNMFNKPQFQVRAAKEKLPKRMALLLLVAVGASLLVVLRPEAPLSPPLTGEAARLELEVRLDAQGNRLGRAAHWRLPDAGERVASHCQEAKVWRAPVVRVQSAVNTPQQAVVSLAQFLQGCEVGEIVLGQDAPQKGVQHVR